MPTVTVIPNTNLNTGTSIVDYLKSQGQASDYASRATLAAKQGIQNYTGTAQQNTQLLGILNKPSGSMTATGLSNPVTPATLPTSNPPPVPTIIPPPAQENTGGLPPDMQKILDSYTAPTAPDYAGAEATAGIPEKTQLVSDLTAKINAITANQQAQELKMKEEGISTGAIQGRNYDLERQNAIAVLPLQAQLSAAQGDLTTATQHLDKLFGYQQDYAKAMADFNNKKIDAVYQYATDQQKAQLDAKKTANTQAYTTQQNNLNQAQTWATTAIQQGQGQLASQIMALDPNDPQYQTKLGVLAGQIQPKATTTGTTIKSGNIVVNEGVISSGQTKLDQTRGTDGYANTDTYLQMLALWKSDGGLEQDFFKYYPPKQYLNPNEGKGSIMPQYIKDMLKVGTGINISSEDISGALNNNQ
jgi:flagellar biosynthesis chaperone FliJ